MPSFARIIAELKKQEHHLAAQLASIRTAISSLEFGSSGVPAPAIIETPNAVRVRSTNRRRRRKMSAAARAKISAAQRKRWARVKAEKE